MNLFELSAKISVDDSDFKKSMENAQKVSKNVAKAVEDLQNPLDKAKSRFEKISHPIETAKKGFEDLKNKVESVRHPIETFKVKVQESSTALETQRNKLSVLAAGYDSAQKKVDELTKEFNKSAKESGTSSKKTQELAEKLKEAESKAANAKKEMDDFAESVSKAGKNSGSAKDKIAGLVGGLGKVASGLGTAVVTAAKVGAAAVGAASTGIAVLTKSAVDGFAEYEQLAGGAAKIFDEMNQADILRDAQNAYKDLGLSANQYLAVINDVGATFAATMGDAAGYEAAKTGLKAISDYASGTGKNVDELSQKFTLITRSTSSYQSIADQFSGILPATSAGFLEQAQAAGILSGKYKQLTEVPIDEYQAAVSKMLEKGVADLGLANNTMDEAFSTLSGSLAMAKGAWSNLVTGLANDSADLDTLINNFVESVVAATRQIIPTIGKALDGIGTLINEIVPVALDYIPKIIVEFLPKIAGSAVGIVTSIGTAIFDNIDQILEFGQQMLDSLLEGITSNVDSRSGPVTAIITKFANFIAENLPEIIMAGINILGALLAGIIQAIPELATAATKAVIELASYILSVENLEKVLAVGGDLIESLAEGISNALDLLVQAGANVVESIKQGIASAWDGIVSWFEGLWDGLFGNRTANVNVNATSSGGIDGSHASGLDYVPYNNYVANLHRGEMVLTARQAENYRNGGKTGGDMVFQISINGMQFTNVSEMAHALANDISHELEAQTRRKAALYG